MKKLTIEVTDIDALEAFCPACIETVTTKVANRAMLRPLIKAMHSLGKQVDGVKAYYADEKTDTVSLGELFDHMMVKGDSHD